MNNFTICRCY